MATRVPYSASTLARAASGDSLPHRDLALAYVRACGGDEDEWRCRWDAAAARAALPSEQDPARPLDGGLAPRSRHGSLRMPRRLLVIAATAGTVLAAAGATTVVALPGQHHQPSVAAAKTVAAGSTVAGWGICWGGGVGRIQPTDAVMFGAANSLQITVAKPNEVGDFAVCTHHGLRTVHPGTRVTVRVRASALGVGSGLGFFVYDSRYTPTWAPETPKGDHVPLPTGAGWHTYVWTVPKVDQVITMGVEVYSVSDQPLIVWLGAVTW